MYGWRARIGFMLPSSCTVYEQEFIKVTSGFDGVIGCAARLLIESTDAGGLQGMNRHVELAAKELATIDPDVVVYMCTSGSFLEGGKGELKIRRDIQALTKCPIIPTTQAVVKALQQFSAKRIVMLTPYNEDITRREVNYLRSTGIRVVDYRYLDIEDNLARGAQSPEVTFEHARKLNFEKADAIFLSCGNIRTLEASSSKRNAAHTASAPGKTPPPSARSAPARKPTSATSDVPSCFALAASSDLPPSASHDATLPHTPARCGSHTAHVIPLLERHTGKPVVASSPATTWLALRTAGIDDAVEGIGRLMGCVGKD